MEQTDTQVKFAPGPWKKGGMAAGGISVRSVTTGSRVALAFTEEDADLIAATPALYEALEMTICHGCGNRIGWTGAVKGRDWKTCHSCAGARAALALAEGAA